MKLYLPCTWLLIGVVHENPEEEYECITYELYREILIGVTIMLGLLVVWKCRLSMYEYKYMGKLVLLYGICTATLAFIGLYEGVDYYRNDLKHAYGLETAERLCYAYETEATTIENDSILGVRLLATSDVSDPWFHNNGMTLYTCSCFFAIGIACMMSIIQWYHMNAKPASYLMANAASTNRIRTSAVEQLLRRASLPFSLPNQHVQSLNQRRFTIDYNAPNAVVERLASLMTMWLLTLALVAYFFAPLPICRFITTLGLLHNIVEMWIIRELGLSSPNMRNFRWTVWLWGFLEILGGVLLGTVETQFMTFGIMGATCDVGLFVIATFVIYDTKQVGRLYCALSFYSHCTYVALYFANCMFYPPLGKILGVFFNMISSLFGAYGVYHMKQHATHKTN